MSWNQAYLDAVGVPRWVPRETAEEVNDDATEVASEQVAEVVVDVVLETTEPATKTIGVKALVNNPQAKFAILVDEKEAKADLQKAWKQLKFAWKQWQKQEFPASLFQLDSESSYELSALEQQNIILLDTSNQSQQSQKISAPKLLSDKKQWWQLLQEVHEKSQLL